MLRSDNSLINQWHTALIHIQVWHNAENICISCFVTLDVISRRVDVTDSDHGLNVSDQDFDHQSFMSAPSADTRRTHSELSATNNWDVCSQATMSDGSFTLTLMSVSRWCVAALNLKILGYLPQTMWQRHVTESHPTRLQDNTTQTLTLASRLYINQSTNITKFILLLTHVVLRLHCESKKQNTKRLSITSPHIDRFSKFFYCSTR